MKRSIVLMVLLLLSGSISANPIYAIMDGGSGATRLYVYKVTEGAFGVPFVESIPVIDKKISPGISTAINDCGPYIEPLLTRLRETLAQQGISESHVTVALLATAGMRVQSPKLQQHCYDSVASQIRMQLPGVATGPVQTIQGRYEGALEWLTVNHLNNALSTGTKTQGVLEIGGGSYQIAFEIRGRHPDSLDFIGVSYAGKQHDLFSRSYTGLGDNYSREQLTDNPAVFPLGYPLASGATGSGIYDKGKAAVRKIIRAKPTAIPAAAKKPNLSDFIGVGLYKDVANYVGLGSRYSANQLDATARVTAMTPWSEQVAKEPHNPDLFSKVYSAQLVSEMMRTWFPANQILEVADTLNGTRINWTLGAALFLQSGNILP